MALLISPDVRLKLARKSPPVQRSEIIQCFANRQSSFLEDIREDHKTDPPTLWFISETDFGRNLKVVFIDDGNDITIKTVYDPSQREMQIYQRVSVPAAGPTEERDGEDPEN